MGGRSCRSPVGVSVVGDNPHRDNRLLASSKEIEKVVNEQLRKDLLGMHEMA